MVDLSSWQAQCQLWLFLTRVATKRPRGLVGSALLRVGRERQCQANVTAVNACNHIPESAAVLSIPGRYTKHNNMSGFIPYSIGNLTWLMTL